MDLVGVAGASELGDAAAVGAALQWRLRVLVVLAPVVEHNGARVMMDEDE